MWKRKHKGKLGKIKFSQKKTYASNGENLDLLTDEGAFDTFREDNCTVSPKEPFTAISPKIILKMMSMKKHLKYGNTSG